MLANRMMGSWNSSLIWARTWELYIYNDRQSGSNVEIYELEFRPEKGVPFNPGTGVPRASSVYNYNGYVYPVANAFDGNTGTSWAAGRNSGYPQWINYTYNSPIAPVEVYINNSSKLFVAPNSFDVRFGGTTIASFTNVTYTNGIFTGKLQ